MGSIRIPRRFFGLPPERIRGQVFVCLLILFASGWIGGCATTDREEEIVPQRDINTVLNEQAPGLIARDDVVMVAVGELADGTPCIQVYVDGDVQAARREIGERIEGHPVDYIESGEIRPLR